MIELLKGGLEGYHPIPEEIYHTRFLLAVCIQVPAVLIDLIDPWLEGLIDFMGIPQCFPNLKSRQVVADSRPAFFFCPGTRVLASCE